jgi:ketosteroid isomerase-like protein
MADVPPDVASVINAMSNQFVRRLHAREIDTLVEEFYAENATLFPPDSMMITGRAAISDAIRDMIEAGLGDLSMEAVKIEASGNLAYRSGRYRLGPPVTDQETFIEVHRRQSDGSWQCVADIFDSDGLPRSR